MVIIIILVLSAVIYLVVHIALYRGLSQISFQPQTEVPFVSIIIAARNEEKHLPRLLSALSSQSYPHYEIIIANDRSTDSTAVILEKAQHEYPNLRVITITDYSTNLPPKKNALTLAIQAARGEILCFTDADCIPQQNWLYELVSAFEPSVGLVAGYSPYMIGESATVLSYFVAYEEFRAAVWSAGAIGLRLAWLCTGRNLAYRKRVFEEVGGYEATKMSISGDDDLFLQTVRRKTKWHIRYVTKPQSHVTTYPPSTLKQFIEQRKRHFSAARFFSLRMKIFFVLYHGANTFIFFMFLIGFFNQSFIYWCLGGYCTKLLADHLLLHKGASILEERKFLKWFIPMEILYIFYNAIIGPLGLVFKFSWKQ
ncbi:MAG: glycosyltransferase [Bacteroidetes bacterium]|nr:glycosyltransferase [Bacteroidota bacterium]